MESKIKAYQAEIRLRDQRVGILLRQADQDFLFRYDESYVMKSDAISIAICFPTEKREFSSVRLHPFFDNLIMEGWLLNQTEKKFHIDKKNRWGLLMLIGSNPIGAVSIHALNKEGELISENEDFDAEKTKAFSVKIAPLPGMCSFCLRTIQSGAYHAACYKKLWGTSKVLRVQLDEEQPLLSFSRTVNDGSISGAQRKGLFTLLKSELHISAAKSAFILKPVGNHPELPANEHLTMTAARRLGFDVPPTGLIEIEKVGLVFVIRRFDRTQENQKLLVEDMAQIYEAASQNKYSLSHEKVGQAISAHTQAGPLNLNDYFRRVLFCFLTANGDMHLKNWSLLEMEKNLGIYRLSPIYDWLNTRIALVNEKSDLAISLGGKDRNIQKSYFKKFALKDLKLSESYVEKVFGEVPEWTTLLRELIPQSFLSKPMKEAYLQILEKRAQILN